MLHELLSAVGRQGHSLSLLPVFSRFRKVGSLTDDERKRFEECRGEGMNVLDPVFPSQFLPPQSEPSLVGRAVRAAGRLVRTPKIEDFYPAIRAAASVEKSLNAVSPDALLTVWSAEGVAATHHYQGAPRVVYHGDIDPQVRRARFAEPQLFDGVDGYPFWTEFNRRQEAAALETVHWQLMKKADCIANITASNAAYYTKLGHPRSMYARNTWIDAGRRAAPKVPKEPVKIVGHFGYLDRTGSTFGLRFLLDVLPELEREMAGIDYEVHVIGGGQPAPGLRARLKHPRLKVRGFVPDLDSELAEAAAVMMLNNAGPYQAAFTRHIVTWSLGGALVVHENSRRAIPEITPEVNALTGTTAADVARAVKRAVTDMALNGRLRDEGRATYEKFFRPDTVAATLDGEIRRCVEER